MECDSINYVLGFKSHFSLCCKALLRKYHSTPLATCIGLWIIRKIATGDYHIRTCNDTYSNHLTVDHCKQPFLIIDSMQL